MIPDDCNNNNYNIDNNNCDINSNNKPKKVH